MLSSPKWVKPFFPEYWGVAEGGGGVKLVQLSIEEQFELSKLDLAFFNCAHCTYRDFRSSIYDSGKTAEVLLN